MLEPYLNGEKEFSKEVAFDVLKATNYEPCIMKLLDIIEGLPADVQVDYKDVVLAGCCDIIEEAAIKYKEKFGFEKHYTDFKVINNETYQFSRVNDRRLRVELLKK